MEQIKLSEDDIEFLKLKYPDLQYNEADNLVSGSMRFCRIYDAIKICGGYSIEFKLENGNNSILPLVRETKGKILSIAKRKKISKANMHLNTDDGVLCLIFPIKEKEYYPNGFELSRFMNHLEEHFYWITFFDRYNKKPWEDEPHGLQEALLKATSENNFYRKDLKDSLERELNRKITRPEFRRYLKVKNIL